MEFGNATLTRESMRRVWRPRWLDEGAALGRDIRFALRSLLRARVLAATVVVTLALAIGANAAIFSVVRGVLLRPLVNRDEDHIVYVRPSAPGAASAWRGGRDGRRGAGRVADSGCTRRARGRRAGPSIGVST